MNGTNGTNNHSPDIMVAGRPVWPGFTSPITATVIERASERVGEHTGDCTLQMSPQKGRGFLRPTYGTVSRYGVVPMACSMDQVGVDCGRAADGLAVLARIAGYDPRDGAMFPDAAYTYAPSGKTPRMAAPVLPHLDVLEEVYAIIKSAEIAHNFTRYDGIKFPVPPLGDDIRNNIDTGNRVLQQANYERCYVKAMRIRRVYKDALDFADYDLAELPYPVAALTGCPAWVDADGRCLIAPVKGEGMFRAL